jgi:predicted transcriptional regulator
MKSLDKLAGLLENEADTYIKQGWFTVAQASEKFKLSKDAVIGKLNRLHKAGKVQKKTLNNGRLSLWFVP